MSDARCPGCLSPFARGRKLAKNRITVQLNFCPLCGDYVQRIVRTSSLSVPLVEVVKTSRFRSVVNG